MTSDPKPWTVRASRYVFREPPWWTLREDHVELPNGAEIERYWITELPPFCNVVAVTPSDEIVLLRQYRHGVRLVHFEIPGGVADHGDPLTSARTELLQETGYGGGEWSPLMTAAPNPALADNFVYSFLARGVERVQDPQLESTEDLRVELVPAERVLGLVDRGEMIQSMQIAPLLRYLLTRSG